MKLKPLAIAVGAAMPLAAAAATITGPATTASTEYLAVVGSAVPDAATTVALGFEYIDGDVIKLTFSAPPRRYGEAGTTAAEKTQTFDFPSSVVVAVTGGTNGSAKKFDQTDTTVSYRIDNAPTPNGSNFGVIDLGNDFGFKASEIGTGVTVSSISQSGQLSFDAGKAAKVIVPNGSQYAFTVAGLSQTIDVQSGRKAFVAGAATAANHTITVSIDDDVKSPDLGITSGDFVATLTGDFSWLDSNTATTAAATGIQFSAATGDEFAVLGVSGTAMTISTAVTAGDNDYELTLTNSTKQEIPVQALALSATQRLTGSTVGVASATASGAYKLNGSSITVYAVPTSSAVSNFIWLSNTGKSSGDVSITVYDNGKTIDLGVVGTSKGGSEFDVTAGLNAALEAKGVTLSGGRVHMDVVTNVPTSDVAISAAYRVGDDRVNLLTSAETN